MKFLNCNVSWHKMGKYHVDWFKSRHYHTFHLGIAVYGFSCLFIEVLFLCWSFGLQIYKEK